MLCTRATWVRGASLLAAVALVLLGPAVVPDHPAMSGFVAAAQGPPPLDFFKVPPCRAVDTRLGGGPLVAGIERRFPFATTCGIPSNATAVSVNVAVTQPTAAGNVRLYPASTPVPITSTINYAAGQTRTNNTVVGLGTQTVAGVLAAQCQPAGSTHLIVDVNGYFAGPPGVCDTSDLDGDGHTTCDGDCCDNDQNVFPGQGFFFSVASLCGGYDYNCDNYWTPQFTAISDGGPACHGTPPNCIADPGIGWLLPQAPGCGLPVGGAQYRDCSATCTSVDSTRVQSCH